MALQLIKLCKQSVNIFTVFVVYRYQSINTVRWLPSLVNHNENLFEAFFRTLLKSHVKTSFFRIFRVVLLFNYQGSVLADCCFLKYVCRVSKNNNITRVNLCQQLFVLIFLIIWKKTTTLFPNRLLFSYYRFFLCVFYLFISFL